MFEAKRWSSMAKAIRNIVPPALGMLKHCETFLNDPQIIFYENTGFHDFHAFDLGSNSLLRICFCSRKDNNQESTMFVHEDLLLYRFSNASEAISAARVLLILTMICRQIAIGKDRSNFHEDPRPQCS